VNPAWRRRSYAPSGLLERYRAMVDVGAGCGPRQGEVFGLTEDVVDVEGRTLHVVRQIKHVEGRPVLALPKAARNGPCRCPTPWRKPAGRTRTPASP
jgi:integrase